MIATRALLAASIYAASAVASPALGTTTFENFGPGFSYDPDLSYIVGIDGFGVNSIGVQFTAEETGFFSTLWIAASAEDESGIDDGLVFTIRSDENGEPNGALESIVFDDVCFETDCPDGQVYSRAASGNALLSAGEQYWLVATVADPASGFSWFAAAEDQGPGVVWIQNALFPDGAVFQVDQPPAFRIDVILEPGEISEPGAANMLATIAVATLLLARRRRKE